MAWLEKQTGEGFAIDYIRTTDPINEEYLAAHKVFIQLNYPPYRWTPVAEAAFRKAMEQGTIGWIGFHHASLLGKFDGFEMSPFFHDFMGKIVFKSYIREFATGTVHVEDASHPVLKGLPRTFPIENDEWYTYDRSPRPDVHVIANVDENSYQPARDVKMGDHPVIWSNPRVKARNVYFQFGHKGELLQNRYFTRDVPERDPVGQQRELRRAEVRSQKPELPTLELLTSGFSLLTSVTPPASGSSARRALPCRGTSRPRRR